MHDNLHPMNLPDSSPYTTASDGIILTLHIQPRASKNEFCGLLDKAVKLRLTSPPVDGAANKLCREFIAKTFGVPKSSVEIISGETSRHKRIKIVDSDINKLTTIADSLILQQQ